MSYESRSMSNFSGLDELRTEFARLQLEVMDLDGDKHLLENRDRIELLPPTIREIGLKHIWPHQEAKLLSAITKTSFSADQIRLVVVAENPKMKLRELLFSSDLSDPNALRSIDIVGPAVARSTALMSRRDGFELKAHLVLAVEQVPRALKPYRLGAILASATFEVRPTKLGNGIRPRPLTEEVIQLHGLIANSVLFVDQKNQLTTTNNLDDAVTIYVDEEILKIIGTNRSWESKAIQRQLVIESLQQLVFMLSIELRGSAEQGELMESAVLDVIELQLRSIIPKKNQIARKELVSKISENPGSVVSMLSNLDSQRKSLIKFIVGEGD